MTLFSVREGNFQNIIRYAAIDIPENETTFLCGKSGAGKSTLLRLFNNSQSLTSGEIRYRNTPIEELDPILLRREVLLVGQDTYLFDDTISGNFSAFHSYREQKEPCGKDISRFLALCLADFPLMTNCATMSGGERQRVFLAISLSLLPKVLMLDEPTSALDEKTSIQLMENITGYAKEMGITLIVITHDQALAQKYGDRILSLDREAEYE